MLRWLKTKWGVLSVLSTLWALLTIIYAAQYIAVPPDSTRAAETVRFAFLSISGFGVLFSVLLSSFNSLESSQNIKDRIKFDQAENAFEYLRRWESPSLTAARDMTRRIKKRADELAPVQLYDEIRGDQNLERSVITMFNFFEEVYLAIDADIVIPEYLERAFAHVFPDVYRRFEYWIDRDLGEEQRTYLKALRNQWIGRQHGS